MGALRLGLFLGTAAFAPSVLPPTADLATITIMPSSTLLDKTGDYSDATTRAGVDGGGWVVAATMPYLASIAFDPTKIALTVTDPGFDATGTTTVTRVITGRKVLRRQYTQNSSLQMSNSLGTNTVYFSVSDWIYQGSTITAVNASAGYYGSSAAGAVTTVTNSSTLAYKKPLFAWINTQHMRWTGDTLVEAVAVHRHAMNGRQVPRMEFIASDASAHTAATQTVSTTSLSTLCTQGQPPDCYPATIPTSTLTQADLGLVNVKVYPWIGDSSAVLDLIADGVSTSGAVTTARPRTPLRFLNDKSGTYGGAIAYVRQGAGGTPQVSLTDATARANPYATIPAALAAIVTFNNANRGHNDHSGATIFLMDDGASGAVVHLIGAAITGAAGKCWTTIKPDASAVGAVSVNIATTTRTTADLLDWQVNMTQTSQWLDGGTSNGNIRQGFANKTLTIASGPDVPIFYRCGLIYLRNCTISGAQAGSETMMGYSSATRTQCAQALGVVSVSPIGNTGFYPYSVIGCNLPRGVMGESDIVANPNWDTNDWGVVINNKIMTSRLSNTVFTTQACTNFGFLQNLIERAVTASNAALQISADDAIFAVDHFVDHHNTILGERMNRCYQTKPGDIGVIKRCDSKFNIWYEYNCKTDTFDLGGTELSKGRNGNWAERHTVGHQGNVCLVGDHNGTSPLNAGGSGDVWIGDAWPDGNFAVGRANVTFTNDQSLPGGNAGLGTYTLTHGGTDKAANRVPAGAAVLGHDLAGVARPNDGTGSAGAYQ
jgi:hypothetical protein